MLTADCEDRNWVSLSADDLSSISRSLGSLVTVESAFTCGLEAVRLPWRGQIINGKVTNRKGPQYVGQCGKVRSKGISVFAIVRIIRHGPLWPNPATHSKTPTSPSLR